MIMVSGKVLQLKVVDKKYKLILSTTFAAVLLLGFFFALFSAPPAHADDATCAINPNMCSETGGGGGEDNTGGGYKPSKGSGGSGSSRPINDLTNSGGSTSEVKCSNLVGPNAYQRNTTCNVTAAAIKTAIANDSKRSESSIRPMGAPVYDLMYSGASCPVKANGLSAYSVTIKWGLKEDIRTYTTYDWMWPIAWEAGFRGGLFGIPAVNNNLPKKIYTTDYSGASIAMYNIRKHVEHKGTFKASATLVRCNYPSVMTTENFTCFYGYGGKVYWSQNKAAIGSGGTLTKTRGSLPGDPSAPVWNGDPNTTPTCALSTKTVGKAYVQVSADPDNPANGGGSAYNGYGYYRLSPWFKERNFNKTEWKIVGSKFYPNNYPVFSEWKSNYASNDAAPTKVHTTWYGYSCRAGLEGPFGSSGAIPYLNDYFGIGDCPNVVTKWECQIANPTTVGVDRATLPAGSTYFGSTTTVMRNGEKVPLRFGDVRIVDKAGNVDVTNGRAGPTVRNVSNIGYQDHVKAGSTPMFGSDVNSSKQYFKLWPSMGANSPEKWDVWRNDANANVNKGISFNWSSDTKDGQFVAQRTWRVTAEFLVERVGGEIIGDTDGKGHWTTTREWVKDTQNCYERNANGTPNTAKMLTSDSNPVKVVRSVNR